MTMHTKLKFTPSHVLLKEVSGLFPHNAYMSAPIRFAAYQWFCQRFYKFNPKSPKWEQLNGTSSINNSDPYLIDSDYEPLRRLAKLLCNVGHSPFLNSVGIFDWCDLAKPKILTVPWCDNFPNQKWFDLAGREFVKSPNSYHTKATCVYGAALQLSCRCISWKLVLTYGYKHDSSAFDYEIRQLDNEPLDEFTIRVDSELSNILLPDVPGRTEAERDWQRVYTGLKNCMYDTRWDCLHWEKDLTDLIMPNRTQGIGSRKISIDPSRVAVLKSWIENPVLSHTEEKATK